MNAMIREEYEAPVLTNEAIEVHLNYLRAGFDAMLAALPVLRDKIDLLSEKVDSNLEKTDPKIEKSNEQRAAADTLLAGKLDKVEKALEDRGQLKTIVLLFSLVSVSASLASLARSFGWI